MGQVSRKTVHLDARLHRALQTRAARTGETISSVVSRAVTESLREDEIDIRAYEERRNEPSRLVQDVFRDMRRNGRL
jgi:hypothetical protein